MASALSHIVYRNMT